MKFNYSHLKIHPPQVKFDKNTGQEEDKSRYMDSSWVALQKTICCLTAGQIVDQERTSRREKVSWVPKW